MQYQQRQIGFLTIKPGCGTIGALAFQQAIIAATATVLPPRIENPDVTEEWLLTIAHIDLVVRLAQP